MTDAKILVIDDNTAVLSTLRIVLKSVFRTVVTVSDALGSFPFASFER